MSANELMQDNFHTEVLSADQTYLVDFWAPWCGPCRVLGPVIEQIAQENHAGLKVGKVNVDEQVALATQYGVMSIPTVIVFRGGQEVARSVGVKPKEALLELVK